MDQAFFLRAKRLLEQRRPARVDHDMLLGTLQARQAASPTAAAASRYRTAAPPPREGQQALTALVLAEENWRGAAETQAGCFNRAVAARRVNTP
jgi:hypothetical protein